MVFGGPEFVDEEMELNALEGSEGFVVNSIGGQDRGGASVSSAGDVNGDGFADVVVGAPLAEGGRAETGQAYVVFGFPTDPFRPYTDVDLADFLIFQICFSAPANERTTSAECRHTDMDGDGDLDLADLVVFQAAFTGAR